MAREPEKSAREIGKAKNEASSASKNTGAEESSSAKSAAEMLKEQHDGLRATLARRSEANADRIAIVKEFAAAWLPHVAVEQEILVPALKNAGIDEEKLAAVGIHKDIINWLVADLLLGEGREFGQARLEALAKQFDAHVEDADAEDSGVFAFVSSAETSNPGLNAQMKERYDRLKRRFANMDESMGEAMAVLAPRRLSTPTSSQRNRREHEMSRYSNDRDRDEYGRFASHDERGYSRSGSDRDEHGRFTSESGGRRSIGRERDDDGRFTSDFGYSRGRFQGDDQHYGPRSLGSMGRDRDDEGRFTSEGGPRSRGRYDDEDERYGSRSFGRERDDEGRFMSDNGPSRSRFQGDDEHYGPRSVGSMGRDRDNEGRFTRRGESHEGRGEGRDQSGWYGDSEGHSQASRRGWDSTRHGESGWYGDPEGHSEAARRGWERGHEGDYRSRSSRYDDDDRRYESRRSSRYPDDDYDRGNGGRGHGGWSGDPEGHSEASRRGWQNRR